MFTIFCLTLFPSVACTPGLDLQTVSFVMYIHFLADLMVAHFFNYHSYGDDSPVSISSPNLPPEW